MSRPGLLLFFSGIDVTRQFVSFLEDSGYVLQVIEKVGKMHGVHGFE